LVQARWRLIVMAVVAPKSSDSDLIQWGFNTLVSSYATYHGGDGDTHTGVLHDFASRIPVAAKAEPAPVEDYDGAAPRRASAKAERPARRRAAVEATVDPDSLGPVPPPFGSIEVSPSTASAVPPKSRQTRRREKEAAPSRAAPAEAMASTADAGAASPDVAGASEVVDPEAYAQWAKYHRDCAAAYEQQISPEAQATTSSQQQAVQQQPQQPLYQQQQLPPQAHQPTVQQLLLEQQRMQQQILQLQQSQVSSYAAPGGLLPAVAAGVAAPQHSPFLGSRAGPFAATQSPLAGLMPGFPGAAPTPYGFAGVQPQAASDEALASLLMSWYMSGYYTGALAARQGR